MPQYLLIYLFLLCFTLQAVAQDSLVVYYDDQRTVVKEVFQTTGDNILNGPYRSYYASGNLKIRGNYIDNIPAGQWKYYYENGNLKMEGLIKNNQHAGVWSYYYENGNPEMKGTLIDEVRTGSWYFYYESGNLKKKGTFRNGKPTGTWEYYYEDGSLKAQKKIKEQGLNTMEEFYTSGSVRAKGYTSPAGKDSTWIIFYESGEVSARGKYENNRKEGRWIYYHLNGNKAAEGRYTRGVTDGKWTYYHKNGKVKAEGAEQDGVREGYWKLYHSSGTPKGEAVFKKGSGEYREFYPDGELKVVGTLENGKNQHRWNYYYSDGALEGTAEFTDGKGEYTGFYRNGSVKMKGTIENNDQRTGIWKLYKQDGTLAGYYKSIYENNQSVFSPVESDSAGLSLASPVKTGNPDYLYRKKESIHFRPRVNEYRSVLLNINLLGLAFERLPLSLEYYMQERLGYELVAGIHRSPFFTTSRSVDPNTVFDRGYFVAVRQKLYNPDTKTGMFYLGNELGFTNLQHQVKTDADAAPASEVINLTREYRAEYVFLVGTRLMKDASLMSSRLSKESGSSGFTLDFYAGTGLGYRWLNHQVSPGTPKATFLNEIRSNKITVPFRLGVSLGYIF